MASMSSRERVLTTLDHQEPDRVPLDIGGGYSESIVVEGYERLKRRLNVSGETQFLDSTQRVARLDESVMQRLGSDFRAVVTRAPANWTPPPSEPGTRVDKWGVTYRQVFYGEGCYYWDMVGHPLAEATIEDLERFPWPDPLDPGLTAGLADEARDLHEGTEYAITGDPGFQMLWEQAFPLRGYEQLLMDIAEGSEFVDALLSRILELNMAATGRFLDVVGPHIDIIRASDDLATQRGPLMSPTMYRRVLWPYLARYLDFVKSRTDARVFFHTCGNVTDLIDDLVEAGVDAINPVQVSAMPDTSELKARFGHKVSFWGGIDTQHVMPAGSVDDVETEVRRRIRDLAPGGGYVLAAVHNLQPDVPPENILAMADAARRLGTYPIRD